MLSSNFPSAARARLASMSKSSSSTASDSGGSTTVSESFTYTKKTETHGVNDSKKTPFVAPFLPKPHSQATTAPHPWTPEAASYSFSSEETPTDRVLEVSFAEPPPGAVVVDLSAITSPEPEAKVIVKVEPEEPTNEDPIEAFCQECKRRGYAASPPDTPTSKQPPKKKADSCPSDEKKAKSKERVVVDSDDKENAFKVAAPVCLLQQQRADSQAAFEDGGAQEG